MDYREPWIDSNGFIRAQTSGEYRTNNLVEHTLNIAYALTVDERRQGILDARAPTSASPQTWVVFLERLASIVTALAILVSDKTSPQVNRFQAEIDSLRIPCRPFTDEESAVTWLRSLDH